MPALWRQGLTEVCEFEATLAYTRLIQSQRETERWWLTPLIPVFGSHMPLIPALRRWRQEGIWLGRERSIRREKTGVQPIQPEDSWRQALALLGLRIR